MTVSSARHVQRTLLLAAMLMSFMPAARAALTPDEMKCSGKDPGIAVTACASVLNQPHLTEHDIIIAHIYRGNAYMRLGQSQNAIPDLNEVIALDPNYALAYNNRADAYLNLRDYPDAVADFSRAIQIKPDFAPSYAGRGMAYLASGQVSSAASDVEKALAIDPKNADALRLKADVDANLRLRNAAAAGSPASPGNGAVRQQAATGAANASGIGDWLSLFFSSCMLFLIAAAIFLIVLVAIYSEAKPDPTPDNVPYDLPLHHALKMSSGKIHTRLVVLMNLFWLGITLLLYGYRSNSVARDILENGAFLTAVAVWEFFLVLGNRLARYKQSSLTIDSQGVRWNGMMFSHDCAWNDISDVRIYVWYDRGRRGESVQLFLAGQNGNSGYWSDINYPWLNRHRLLETIRKGLIRWGSQAAKQNIANIQEQERSAPDNGAVADIDSDAKRSERGKRRLLWVGLAFIIALPLGILLGLSQGRFIPDEAAFRWGPVAIGVATAAVLFFTLRSVKWSALRTPKAIGLELLSVSLLLAMCLLWGSQAILIDLPDIYTKWAGQPAVREVTALSWHPEYHSRHSHTCAGVTIAEIPSLLGPLCLDRQTAPGTILTLHGRQSVLGFHVDVID